MKRPNSPIILWCGRFSKFDGYGTVARNHLRGLIDVGARVAALDLKLMQLVGPESGAGLKLTKRADGVMITADDPDDTIAVVFHERPDYYRRIRAEGRAKVIGHSVFETESLPPEWLDNLVSMDEVWVATEFNRESFSRAGVPPFMIEKVPHSLDTKAYSGQIGRLRFAGDDTCVFLSVCSGLDRRDLAVLLRSFLRSFSAGDDVMFVIKIRDDLATLQAGQALLDQAVLTSGGDASIVASKVRFVAADYGQEEMIRLYAGCDVYVSPERANGWDLPTMEAMASGKLTIGAFTGGSTEYATDDVSLRIPVADDVRVPIPVGTEPHPFYTAQWWPALDENAVVDAMKRAFSDPASRDEVGMRAQAKIRSEYDIEVVARRILDTVTPLARTDVRSNQAAKVFVGRDDDLWREADDKRTEFVESMLAASLLDVASTPFDPKGVLAKYRAANELRYSLGIGERGPLASAMAEAVATPKERPVQKSIRVARLARQVASSTGSSAERLELRKIERGVRSIQSSEFVDGRTFTDDEMAERRAAFGRFPVIPLSAAEQERLRGLRHRYWGERCFVLGNGPSLNRTDLSKLANEYTFGVNKIFLLFDRIEWRPSFYTLLDWRVGPEIAPHVDELADSVKFFPNRFRGVLPPDDDTYWYTTRPVLDHIDDQFAADIVQGVPSRGTILVTAIQIAFYLGFRDIYLIGADASYSIPDTVKQSGPDRFGTGVKLNLESTADDDPNHFDPRYFGAGAKWHDPNVDEMVRMFRTMRKGVELNGGRLLNATVGGELEVLERVDYESLFR